MDSIGRYFGSIILLILQQNSITYSMVEYHGGILHQQILWWDSIAKSMVGFHGEFGPVQASIENEKKLPLTGIEPGSPALKTLTLLQRQQNLLRYLKSFSDKKQKHASSSSEMLTFQMSFPYVF